MVKKRRGRLPENWIEDMRGATNSRPGFFIKDPYNPRLNIWIPFGTPKEIEDQQPPKNRIVLDLDDVLKFYYKFVKLPQSYSWDELAFIYFYPREAENIKEFSERPYGMGYGVKSISDVRDEKMEQKISTWRYGVLARRFRKAIDEALLKECLEASQCPFKSILETSKNV